MSLDRGLYPKYFVLRPEKDAAALEALHTYALQTDNEALADDLFAWMESIRVDAALGLEDNDE